MPINHYIITFPYNTWNTAAMEQESSDDIDTFTELMTKEHLNCDIYQTPLSLNIWKQLYAEKNSENN